jgi:hypothetical protein
MQGWRFGKPSIERPWLIPTSKSQTGAALPKLTVVNGGRAGG